ncbi:MAG: PLP-dependent aminotransferase family protein [Enterobacterales bacterium]|nr:PLP-dependent aminotransferase family protein [Enterobacterales bacterium]
MSRQRSGLYVNQNILEGRVGFSKPLKPKPTQKTWQGKIKLKGLKKQPFIWPADWQKHPYPFIDGYFDASLYPVSQWQEASRLAFGGLQTSPFADHSDADDARLLEQITTKILPRRGIVAQRDEILITSGSHHALYLITQLLCDKTTRVAMENPGSKSLQSCLGLTHCQIHPQPIDEQGLLVDNQLKSMDLIFLTPSHQQPTAVTMPMERRQKLVAMATQQDLIIIEDDSECESNYLGSPHPALYSIDTEQRVIYLSALSKAIAPGLGLGFILASAEIIQAARQLRRLMVGHPPHSNQRTAAFFLSLGHYDAFMMRIHKIFSLRWNALRDALNHYLPQSILTIPNQGGTAFWVKCPVDISMEELVNKASQQGILIEPVDDYYLTYESQHPHASCFRMGVTSLSEDKIRLGVAKLAKLIRDLSQKQPLRLTDATQSLNQQQLKQKLTGATLICKTVYGAPCRIELCANGQMMGTAGHTDEEYDKGRWWIEDDRWFRQWDTWAYAEQAGFYVTLSPLQAEDAESAHQYEINWFNQNGRLVDTALIQLAVCDAVKLV